MSVSIEALRLQLDYSAWASRRLVAAAAELSEAELTRDFQTADRSVLETLVHTFAGDRIWLWRFVGGPHPGFVNESDRSLAVLQNEWPLVQQGWREWVDRMSDDGLRESLTYRDLKDRQWTQPIWQLVLHVVNHGTHHRGQVAGFLRSMGRTPPPLDLVYYCREVMTSLPTPSA